MTRVRTTTGLQRYCDRFQDASAHALCFRWFPLAPRIRGHLNEDQAARVCDGLADRDDRIRCYLGIGRLGPDNLEKWHCSSLRGEERRVPCVYGRVVADVLFNRDRDRADVLKACLRMRDAERSACMLAYGRIIGVNTKDDLDDRCAALTDAAAAGWCERGAALQNEPIDVSDAELGELERILDGGSAPVAKGT